MASTSPDISQHRPDDIEPRGTSNLKVSLSLLAATFVCYANSIRDPFIWDHEEVIVNNPLIRSLHNIPQAFHSDLFGKPLSATGFYRPIGVITYMLDYRVWGLNAAGFHVTSILLHAIAAILLFYLFRKMSLPFWVNFLVCLFFAINPINTETVTYLFREESLGVIFSCACFISYLKVREGSIGFAVPAAVSFAIAMLSKETSVVLPFLLAVESALWGRERMSDERHLRASRYVIAGLVAVSVGYIVLRQHLIASSGLHFISTIRDATEWQRVLTLPYVIATYIGLVLFPIHLHMEYLFVTENASQPAFWLNLLLLCAGAAALIWHVRNRPASERNYQRRIIFFACWFLLGIAPFTHVIIPLQATIREHWAYFASIGLLAIVVSIGDLLYCHFPAPAVRGTLMILLVGMLAYDVVTTVLRNHDWSTPLRLYSHDLQYEPRSFLLHTNLGLVYFREGRLEDAKREYLQAIQVSPGHAFYVAYYNLGVLYERQGRDDLAESAYRKSISLADYEPAYVNLAYLYLRTHHLPEATAVGEDGVMLYPANPQMHYYLALAYVAQNRFADAKRELTTTERLSPGYQKTRELLQTIAQRSAS